MSDFHDERVQRIADVTFNDEDGEGAVAEWWDMLASIDTDLAALTERGGSRPDGRAGSDREVSGDVPGPSALPRSVSAADHTTAALTAQQERELIARWNDPIKRILLLDEIACDLGGVRDEIAAVMVEVEALRARAAAADTLADALREIADHEPQHVSDDTFGSDVEACEECARCRQREWPPSRLCDKHYTRMAKTADRNDRNRASQHLEMRTIARSALSAYDAATRADA